MSDDVVDVGIACPNCGCRHMRAIWTRRLKTMNVRRRDCRHCGQTITTREYISQIKPAPLPAENINGESL